jgi:GDPmannose 4,6-dehydratase
LAADLKVALILGISGQDGAYLAQQLCASGYTVHGTSRDREIANLGNLTALGLADRIRLHSVVPTDFRSVIQAVNDIRPTEIYNLSGQSSVGLSFETPVETLESIVVGTLNVLESIRFLKLDARFYNASSSESFGDTLAPATELDPFRPVSPYGVAKSAAHWAVCNYRDAYGIFACSGILFNHESPMRPARFVTQKIVRGAVDIAQGRAQNLALGNLNIQRDWGWAPEYVDAMVRMLAQDRPEDFVIGTGLASRLEDFVSRAFECVGLDWREHVHQDASLQRPLDLRVSVGNPEKAKRLLGWSAQVRMPELVNRLVEAEFKRRQLAS